MTLSLTGAEAAARLRLPYSTLDLWARSGLVVPTVEASGSGSRRSYAFADLVALSLMKRMRGAELPSKMAARIVAYVQALAPTKLVRGLVVVCDGEHAWSTTAEMSLPREALRGVFVGVSVSDAIRDARLAFAPRAAAPGGGVNAGRGARGGVRA